MFKILIINKMMSQIKFPVLLLSLAWFMFSCGSQKTKKEEVVGTKSDTVVSINSKTHEVTKIIHDTVYVKTTIEKSKKKKAPSLSAWNKSAKKRITDYVGSVTNINSKSYLEPSDRIAVMDMDGTLWPEKPLYFQMEFMFDRIREMRKDHPEWKKDKLIQAVLDRNIKLLRKFGNSGLFRLSKITQTGMTTEQYSKIVTKWINTAKNPATGKLYKDMIYLPMVQMIKYLEHYDFKVFVVTEGGSGFLRSWIEGVTGIPAENVVASRRKLEIWKNKGKIELLRDPELEFVNNKENKVIAIQQDIGKVPVIAIGNSDDDIPMLDWTSQKNGKTLVALVHHTDAKREWAYDEDSKVGKLDKGLKLAANNGWFVIDMKNDWNKIYIK